MITEPLRDAVAFVVHPELAMTAAGNNYDARAGGFFLCREINRQAGMMDAGHNVIALRRDANCFWGCLALGTRSAVWPKLDYLGLGGPAVWNQCPDEHCNNCQLDFRQVSS